MNKVLKQILKLIVTVAFLGMLLSIILDWGGRFELVCCTVATVGTFVLFSQKKKRIKNEH